MIFGDSKVDWKRFDAVLFDLDGVITATATVHSAMILHMGQPIDQTTCVSVGIHFI